MRFNFIKVSAFIGVLIDGFEDVFRPEHENFRIFDPKRNKIL